MSRDSCRSQTLVKARQHQKARRGAERDSASKRKRRIDERCPGSAPQIGERVWYVYGEVQNAVLQYEKAEDLGFATETDGFRADVVYYYEHSVRNALESIFEIFNANPAVLFEDLLRNARNKRNRQSEISSFFTSVTKS